MRLPGPPVRALLALGAAVAGIASCSSTPSGMLAGLGGGGGGPVVVYGRATSGSLDSVVANVTAIAEDSACSGISYGSASGTTSPSGDYAITLTSTSRAAGCVVVSGSANGNVTTTTQGGVSFGPGDSVQMNLSFP